eukprot:m.114220 g.114220  ORF g.114220 m.114220 type:complete len:65 (+) comp37477_c1_seq1:534-728(+)
MDEASTSAKSENLLQTGAIDQSKNCLCRTTVVLTTWAGAAAGALTTTTLLDCYEKSLTDDNQIN